MPHIDSPNWPKCELLIVLLCIASLNTAGARVLSLQQAHRIGHPPKIDGKLADPAWSRIQVNTAFYMFDSESSRPSQVKTACRTGFDSKGLYLALKNYEEHPDRITAKAAERDAPDLWRDDSVEIYLSPGPDDPSSYRKLSVNAAGTQWDQLWKGPGKGDMNWDAPVFANRMARLKTMGEKLSNLNPEVQIVGPEMDTEKGVDVFTVRSPYLSGKNRVEILLPDDSETERRYPVLYVLPVNPGIGGRWGDCLQEVKKTGLHNENDLICVTMEFDTVPWYGAHATNPSIRHEDYIKEVVVPLVEKHYPVTEGRAGRMLLGFSKSGWGSFSLILRNPGFFGYACSWDAPLIMDGDDFGIWSTEKHWGTKDNFLNYRPTRWAEDNAVEFREQKRLVLLGHQFFGNRWACPKDTPHTKTFHERLMGLGIPHVYDNTLEAAHSWNQKWLRPAVQKLLKIARE